MKKIGDALLVTVLIISCISFVFSFYKTVIKGDFVIVNMEPVPEEVLEE